MGDSRDGGSAWPVGQRSQFVEGDGDRGGGREGGRGEASMRRARIVRTCVLCWPGWPEAIEEAFSG